MSESEIPSEVFPKVVTMNALTEYLEDDGRNLENGMIVMIWDAANRFDSTSPAANWANRWCRVTQLEKQYGTDDYPRITFVGEYADGQMLERGHVAPLTWIVKRNSVPNRVTIDVGSETHSKTEGNLVTYFRLEDAAVVEQVHGSPAKFMQFHLDEFVNNPQMPKIEGKITATVEFIPGGFVQFRLEGVV
jgi:hypothetical protein